MIEKKGTAPLLYHFAINAALGNDPFASFCITNQLRLTNAKKCKFGRRVCQIEDAALGSQFAIVQGRKLRHQKPADNKHIYFATQRGYGEWKDY